MKTDIFTLGNLAKLIAFLTIAVLLQIALQKLIHRITTLFESEESQRQKEGLKTKKTYKILSLLTGLINLAFVYYLIYATIIMAKGIPPFFESILKSYGKIVLYAFIAFLGYRVGVKFISKSLHIVLQKTAFTESLKQRAELREKTLTQTISYLLAVTLSIFFVYQSLTSFGINLTTVLAAVGVVGLAIGFGAQSLVKDYLNGFFILLEDRFAVGDVINANGMGGLVEKFTLRTTSLRNTAGILITIPNSEINTLQNLTKDWSRVDLTIGVDYSTDIRKALNIMREELEELKKEMPEDLIEPSGQPPDVLALESFGDSSLNLRIWFKTKPSRQWEAQRRYNLRLLERFNKEGITIPFPQQTLSMRDELGAQIKSLMK